MEKQIASYEGETGKNEVSKSTTLKQKIVKIAANLIIVITGLSTGVAIVHGTVVQQCKSNDLIFEAGVLPEGKSIQQQEYDLGIDQCVNQNDNAGFEGGVLPDGQVENESKYDEMQSSEVVQSSSNQNDPKDANWMAPIQNPVDSSVQGANPTTASAPVPSGGVNKSQNPAPKPVNPPKVAPQKAAPVVKKQQVQESTPTPKVTNLDLDKLSMAVAMTETHNCKDKVGSALFNNCHGFRISGKYLKFNTTQESHEYFKRLWAKSYKIFPTFRLAQIYSGNDRPTSWLKNVTYYYNTL